MRSEQGPRTRAEPFVFDEDFREKNQEDSPEKFHRARPAEMS